MNDDQDNRKATVYLWATVIVITLFMLAFGKYFPSTVFHDY